MKNIIIQKNRRVLIENTVSIKKQLFQEESKTEGLTSFKFMKKKSVSIEKHVYATS
jgi:hypothetical protein